MTACVMKEAVPPGLTFSFSGLLVISSSPGVGEGIGVGVGDGEAREWAQERAMNMGSLVVETLTVRSWRSAPDLPKDCRRLSQMQREPPLSIKLREPSI